ncbi:divalent-cation tolerance protein CutA [Vibrio zhanjiangensis]|uniref:Divalent-cation tolerance protein CutA n=1 Tax=Vibrio zhanjiangensis TaxID=1046128 RepID=A0ABQ6F1U7_9VIBR|nr:divalent-cation tolerance protein CutA [Vibrio zhanjiangensis]GLT19229.1 divalent-cation tolerance protein CutA [Vibrio zhanjiangensis]
MKEQFCIVLTTIDSPDQAKKMTQMALESELAACVQSMPIQSSYRWQGKVCHDNEMLLIFKTKVSCYEKLEEAITSTHSYELPEVIKIPITGGYHPYLLWLEQTTRC